MLNNVQNKQIHTRARRLNHGYPPAITNFRPRFLFPLSTNYVHPPAGSIPGHAIPVTEVHKWQQQPKLHQPQQQILSNAG